MEWQCFTVVLGRLWMVKGMACFSSSPSTRAWSSATPFCAWGRCSSNPHYACMDRPEPAHMPRSYTFIPIAVFACPADSHSKVFCHLSCVQAFCNLARLAVHSWSHSQHTADWIRLVLDIDGALPAGSRVARLQTKGRPLARCLSSISRRDRPCSGAQAP